MRLLCFLLLCSYSFQGFSAPAPTIDVDCDDLNIFESVDEAIKSWNSASDNGSKYILHRITDAKILEEKTSLVHHFVTFNVRESVCSAKDEKSWKECDFKLDYSHTGRCSTHVIINTEENTKKVFSASCSIIPKASVDADVTPCPGCYQPLNPNNASLSPLIQFAIEKMNKLGNHPFYFDLENVVSASRQVVERGWNYMLRYNVIQTNCSKSVYSKMSPEECKIDLHGQKGNCVAWVHVDPQGEIQKTDLQCHSSSGLCLNCPNAVETNDPEVQALVKQFVEKYNSESNFTNLYTVDKVVKAMKNVESDKKQYILEFSIQQTNCSKADHAKLDTDCTIQPTGPGNHLVCNATVDVVNKTINILPYSTCHAPGVPFVVLSAVIKGYSPLRSARRRRMQPSEKSKSNGQNHHVKEKHGKKGNKDNKHKDQSSEESEEGNMEKPQTQTKGPIVPREDATNVSITDEHLPVVQSPPTAPTEEILPGIDETILDLPVMPPPNIRKCPGKMWKPLLSTPPISTESPAVNDLAPPEKGYTVNLKVPEENYSEKSTVLSPLGPFNDDDLLSAQDF